MNSIPGSYQAGFLVGSLTIGILLGLVPLFVGIKTGSNLLGILGLIGCIISSLFVPGASVFTAIVFVIIIIIKNR